MRRDYPENRGGWVTTLDSQRHSRKGTKLAFNRVLEKRCLFPTAVRAGWKPVPGPLSGTARQPRAAPRARARHGSPVPATAGAARVPAAVPQPGRAEPCHSRHSPPHDAGLDLDLPEARVGHGGGRRDCAAPRRACAEPPAWATPPERAGAFSPSPAQWRWPGRGAVPPCRSRPAQ